MADIFYTHIDTTKKGPPTGSPLFKNNLKENPA